MRLRPHNKEDAYSWDATIDVAESLPQARYRDRGNNQTRLDSTSAAQLYSASRHRN